MCAKHGYTWKHCPHGRAPGQCWKGDGPGEIRTKHYHDHDYRLFATREAAEDYLSRWQREQARERQEAGPELKRLRMAMVKAHPARPRTVSSP